MEEDFNAEMLNLENYHHKVVSHPNKTTGVTRIKNQNEILRAKTIFRRGGKRLIVKSRIKKNIERKRESKCFFHIFNYLFNF